jgi:homoserine O-acetyltransferase
MTASGIGPVDTQLFTFGSPEDPFTLRSGGQLTEVTVAYETYGELNADRSNAVLLFHALTGSQHAAGLNTDGPEGLDVMWNDECRTGWWDPFIGPGRALDTDRFFVICANYLGGCYGTTGPSSIDPATGEPYGSTFPQVAFCDTVDTQVRLLTHLGINKLHAVVGGSTGGLMVLSLATRYPDLADIVVPIAAGTKTTALQKIHNFEQISAIENDPSFWNGDYYGLERPDRGLMLARMIGHKTFVSLAAMEERARKEVITRSEGPGTYTISDAIESYMWHQGTKFIERFDANSYLRLMEAWQTFDLAAEADVRMSVSIPKSRPSCRLTSSSPTYPTAESRCIRRRVMTPSCWSQGCLHRISSTRSPTSGTDGRSQARVFTRRSIRDVATGSWCNSAHE